MTDGSSSQLWVCLPNLVGIFLLLFLSAAFSAAETACLSLSPTQARRLSRSERRIDRVLNQLLHNPNALLSTLLIGNNVVNILLASLTAALFRQLLGERGMIPAITASAMLIILFGEVLPKNVASHHSLSLARWFTFPLYGLGIALRPARWLLEQALRVAFRLTGQRKPPQWGMISREKITSMLAHGQEIGATTANTRKLAEKILDLPHVTAREIAVPRTDIDGVSDHLTLGEAFSIACRQQHARLPVYYKSMDRIWGFIRLADLPRWRGTEAWKQRLRTYYPAKPSTNSPVHPVLIVPEQARVERLLGQLQRQGLELAVVVDEYGGTNGLLTEQNLRAEILGKLAPFIQEGARHLYRIIGDQLWIDGQCPLRDLHRELKLSLPDEDADTVGGLMMARLGRLPRLGEQIEEAGCRLTVQRMDGNRVGSIRLDPLQLPAPWHSAEAERSVGKEAP